MRWKTSAEMVVEEIREAKEERSGKEERRVVMLIAKVGEDRRRK